MDYMKEALIEAYKAYKLGEIPVGCVIVKKDKIIARAHNLRESEKRAIGHAEIMAIDKANKILNNWRLNDCDLYVTLEPCVMCAGAIISARIKRLVYASVDENMGACGSVIDITNNRYLNTFTNVEFKKNIECEKILMKFFKEIRK